MPFGLKTTGKKERNDKRSESSVGREERQATADAALTQSKFAKERVDWDLTTKGVLGGVSAIVDLCGVSTISMIVMTI